MQHIFINIFALLLASAILLMGNGLQGTLLIVRANSEAFSLTSIGLITSAYFVGFVLGCRYIPKIVQQVGHIRTYTALASIASAAALSHVLFVTPVFWIAIRVISGFCFAGLSMVIESWLNDKATNKIRGRVLSTFRMVDLGAVTVGQLLLTLADPMGFTLFALVSILLSLALVPIALTKTSTPKPIAHESMSLKNIYKVSPLGAVGSFTTGIANTAFWAMGPVFVQNMGYKSSLVAAFMSTAIIGGAVTQWPMGLMSDKIDRRIIVLFATVMAMIAGIALYLVAGISPFWMLAGVCLFGGFAIPLFGLCMAHANDYAKPENYVSLNSGLLFLYGVGAMTGPVLVAPFMSVLGTQGLFAYTATMHSMFLIFAIWRYIVNRDRKRYEDDYIPMQMASTLHPATPETFELEHPRHVKRREKLFKMAGLKDPWLEKERKKKESK